MKQNAYLEEMVLHDVPDYTELVEVTAAALRPDVLLERDLHALDALAVPRRLEELVRES